MDYEDFLAETFSPLKAIETISDVIYIKANEDWNFLSDKTERKDFEELLSLNCAIQIISKHLLTLRETESRNIKY